MKPIECTIKFNNCCCNAGAMSSIFVGLKTLEKSETVKIKKIIMDPTFSHRSIYPHRYVIEVIADGKTLAYDMSDGYQDFDFPEVFDKQLDRVDFYFKSSYSPEFAAKLQNKDKFHNMAMAFHCSCNGNPFDTAVTKNTLINKNYKGFLYNLLTMRRTQAKLDYKNFESNNHYDSYNVLFWTRLWDWDHLTVEHIMNAYPSLTRVQAQLKAESQIEMLKQINEERIRSVRLLREAFGDRFTGGLSENPASLREAPDLITTDPAICTREGYLDSLRKNCIHVLSKGLHGCVGARYGETFAAGRALITDPFVYEPVGGLQEGANYLKYTSPEEIVKQAVRLTENIEAVHEMENSNFRYYNEFVRPDVRILNTFKIAFPERFEK